ncbi:MAG: hypothetical protein AB8B72_10475 [Crocinitomicaceae bacterium]
MTDINEGLTNNYLVHGVALLVFTAPLAYFSFLFYVPFVVFAVALFMSSNGLMIDKKNNRYRKYSNILGYKLGEWKPIKNIVSATLILSIERAKTNQSYLMGKKGITRSKTYDITLYTDTEETILMYEFLKYSKAIKALNAIELGFNIDIRDKVKEKLMRNRMNPRR